MVRNNTDLPAKSVAVGVDALDRKNVNKKVAQLQEESFVDPTGQALTTSLGVRVSDNQNTLSIGPRGPQLLEDFLMRDKLIHFDRERIPERVVHARGLGAHGVFKPYAGNEKYTKAHALTATDHETPVFMRISTVQGGRGSADLVRDVRGFAIKFYTEEGNWDIVGNDIPVFFIQDAIKFPDFVHAVKPENPDEVPTGQSAHDTFWEFVSNNTEAAHMTTWVMSPRGIPRSLRTVQGFGIHTFAMVNAENEFRFVKWHFTPKQGVYSTVWDEATTVQGKDPDFHRRDMWSAIESGHYPQWELGAQIFTSKDAENWDFDFLDSTKLIPEELVPITPLGLITLNRNPEDFFAETEQVAFSPANIVPGIEFSNDPLLQGRLFSYTDTHLHRLGTANFNQIPINKPVCPFATNRRGGFAQMHIHRGQADYNINQLDGGFPKEAPASGKPGGGFATYPAQEQGAKVRQRPDSFADHFSQASLHYNSLSPHEQAETAAAYAFELSKVKPWIRQQAVDRILININDDLAKTVAAELGVTPNWDQQVPKRKVQIEKSPSLSIDNHNADHIVHRRVAVLMHDGANADNASAIAKWGEKEGAVVDFLGASSAPVKTKQGSVIESGGRRDGEPSVTYDAVVVLDSNVNAITKDGVSKGYITQAYKHLKPIVFLGDNAELISFLGLESDEGTLTGSSFDETADAFKKIIMKNRVWSRAEAAATVA